MRALLAEMRETAAKPAAAAAEQRQAPDARVWPLRHDVEGHQGWHIDRMQRRGAIASKGGGLALAGASGAFPIGVSLACRQGPRSMVLTLDWDPGGSGLLRSSGHVGAAYCDVGWVGVMQTAREAALVLEERKLLVGTHVR